MRKMNSTYTTQFLSEEGNKLINRDYFAYVELEEFACYVLADGLDNDKDKKSAEIVVSTILHGFTQSPSMRKGAIKRYIKEAHKALLDVKDGMQLKASISVVVTNYLKARYCTVGNSRFYLLRKDRILIKSNDQSLTNNMIRDNALEQDKASLHEERNNLYSYLGMHGKLQLKISKKIKLVDSDIWLLLTRGIWEYCDDGELTDATTGTKEAKEVIDNVEDLILSKQPEELDNYSMAVTFVDKIYKPPEKKWTAKKILMIVLPIILILAVVLVIFIISTNRKNTKTRQMNTFIESAEKYVDLNNYTKASEDYAEALKLAKDLNKKTVISDIDKLKKLLDQILLGDQAIKDGDYLKAAEAYRQALKLSADVSYIAQPYIEAQLVKTSEYEEIFDLLERGDALVELGDDEAAREMYLEAKNLANKSFFQDGKQEAVDKIGQIDERAALAKQDAKAENEKKKEEEEAKKLEEEEEAKAEKEAAKAEAEKIKEEEAAEKEAQKEEEAAAKEQAAKEAAEKEEAIKAKEQERLNALEIEKKGNAYYDDGDYENAILYYTTAKDMYNELGLTSRITSVEKKITLAESKNTKKENKETKAEDYVDNANDLIEDGLYAEALLLYNLAKEIYEELNLTDDIANVDAKIAILEKLINPDK